MDRFHGVKGFRLYTAIFLLIAVVLVGSSFFLPNAGAQGRSFVDAPAGQGEARDDTVGAGDSAGRDVTEARPSPLPGAAEIQAMASVYSERITDTAVRNGEWALMMDGRWYYWADGRLLPVEFVPRAEEFVSIRFYRYRLGPVEPRVIDVELEQRLRARTLARADGGTDTRVRFNNFLDTLYQISSRDEAERRVRNISFLGFRTRVHPLLVGPLERVETELAAIADTDEAVREFIEGLSAVHGYNWRNIAGTMRRSYHSYGIAVDLIPRSYGGEWPYWLWAAQGGIDEWWNLPLEDRWQIPQPIIDAFEQNGFIWGGKWLSFDNLHFEYRPESILMAQDQG